MKLDLTTFWQLYNTLRKKLFADMSLYAQLTLIMRMHARAIVTLQGPHKGWGCPTRYFIKKKNGQRSFISRDKVSGRWGPVDQGVVTPLWDDERLSEILADPENTMAVPFFDLTDSILFYLIVL